MIILNHSISFFYSLGNFVFEEVEEGEVRVDMIVQQNKRLYTTVNFILKNDMEWLRIIIIET
jgi:hypothetical protein